MPCLLPNKQTAPGEERCSNQDQENAATVERDLKNRNPDAHIFLWLHKESEDTRGEQDDENEDIEEMVVSQAQSKFTFCYQSNSTAEFFQKYAGSVVALDTAHHKTSDYAMPLFC